MLKKSDPWYIHGALITIIVVLSVVLYIVAVHEPSQIIELEKYYKNESRLRMKNLKEAQLVYFKKNKKFTRDIDELVNFLKTDPIIDSLKTAVDSMTQRPAWPFIKLTHGDITFDSLLFSPKTQEKFYLSIDSTKSLDTVWTTAGRMLRIDTTYKVGTRFKIEDPNNYGYIGDLENEALKTAVSWE